MQISIMNLVYATALCLTLVRAEVSTLQDQSDATEYNTTTEPVTWTPELNDTTRQPPCKVQNLDVSDVTFINKDYFTFSAPPDNHVTKVHVTRSETITDGIRTCLNRSAALKAAILAHCNKFKFHTDEYTPFPNGSVDLYGDVLEPGTFVIDDRGSLTACSDEPDGTVPHAHQVEQSDGIGKVGAAVSIAALVVHLAIFSAVPSLRNVPGCNLAALSVAFLFGCLFYLVGQVKGVEGRFCVASGVLQLYFFLASFFCLNAMAVNVWKTFRLSTRRLVVYSEEEKRRHLVYYMIYAWGVPLLFAISAIIADTTTILPPRLRPCFGLDGVCWLHPARPLAQVLFFTAPAALLIAANAALFAASALVIRSNALPQARLDLALFARLACMMGVTWLVGLVALAAGSPVLWKLSDALNALQGLFLLLLFTCSRRVVRRIRERFGWVEESSENHTTSKNKSSASETV